MLSTTIYPISDVTVGSGWSSVPSGTLASCIDEVVEDDADYAHCITSGATLEVLLDRVGIPVVKPFAVVAPGGSPGVNAGGGAGGIGSGGDVNFTGGRGGDFKQGFNNLGGGGGGSSAGTAANGNPGGIGGGSATGVAAAAGAAGAAVTGGGAGGAGGNVTSANVPAVGVAGSAPGGGGGGGAEATVTAKNGAAGGVGKVVITPNVGSPTTITTAGSSTYTVAAGVTSLVIEVWGGGGGGMGAIASSASGSGGGGGGYVKKTVAVRATQILNVVCGAVGAAGTAQATSNATAGGTSSVISQDKITARWAARSSGSAANETMVISLYQGATLIATLFSGALVRTTFTANSYSLLTAEVAAITDYTDLRLRFVPAFAATETADVSWANLELPVAPPVPLKSHSPRSARSMASPAAVYRS